MNATTYGLDVAKPVFQVYWLDTQTGEIANRKFGRDDSIAFLKQRPPGESPSKLAKVLTGGGVRLRVGHEMMLFHERSRIFPPVK